MGIIAASKNTNGGSQPAQTLPNSKPAQQATVAAPAPAAATDTDDPIQGIRVDDPAIKAAIDEAFGSRNSETGERHANGMQYCARIVKGIETFLKWLEGQDPLKISDPDWQEIANRESAIAWRGDVFINAIKMAETSKKKQLQPQRDAIKAINDRYNPVLELLSGVKANAARTIAVINHLRRRKQEVEAERERALLAEKERKQEQERKAAEERARTANEPKAREEAREKVRAVEAEQVRTAAEVAQAEKPVEVAPPRTASGRKIIKAGSKVLVIDDHVLFLKSLHELCRDGKLDGETICARISKTEIKAFISKNGPDSVPGARIDTRAYDKVGRPKQNGH